MAVQTAALQRRVQQVLCNDPEHPFCALVFKFRADLRRAQAWEASLCGSTGVQRVF